MQPKYYYADIIHHITKWSVVIGSQIDLATTNSKETIQNCQNVIEEKHLKGNGQMD